MRLNLSLSNSDRIVPFDHLPVLAGAFHKWLGKNSWHSEISLYSFSWLKGGVAHKNGITFSHGASWFISSFDESILKTLINGIQHDPTVNYGMKVHQIVLQEDPVFAEPQLFSVASPVLVKRSDGDHTKHFIFSDPESDALLTETMHNKLKKAGLNPKNVRVQFDREYRMPKAKLVNYNGIGNRASLCPVIINGTPEQIAFAWNVGVGNSTGIGFGALN